MLHQTQTGTVRKRVKVHKRLKIHKRERERISFLEKVIEQCHCNKQGNFPTYFTLYSAEKNLTADYALFYNLGVRFVCRQEKQLVY